MTTPHVIASSSGHPATQAGASNNIIGTHFRVGKKIGEGSFGVVFDGASRPSFPSPHKPQRPLQESTFSTTVQSPSSLCVVHVTLTLSALTLSSVLPGTSQI